MWVMATAAATILVIREEKIALGRGGGGNLKKFIEVYCPRLVLKSGRKERKTGEIEGRRQRVKNTYTHTNRDRPIWRREEDEGASSRV
jgi:hypothetical protein